ncbi:MAG: TraR/DksA family transcriptional regulator [Variovorax sp.]|nr:TraR/DksA family transcriptional regulator [Variovorax sp.]
MDRILQARAETGGIREFLSAWTDPRTGTAPKVALMSFGPDDVLELKESCMTGLSEKQLASLRKKLDRREAELSAELASINNEAMEESAHLPPLEAGDTLDQAEARTHETIRDGEALRDALELRRIADARARMRNGSYGRCIDCGTQIPRERLEVQPSSERCVPCQRLYEAHHSA